MKTKKGMAKYISTHTLACMTRQGIEALMQQLIEAEGITTLRTLANTTEGKLICEFEAENKAAVEAWLTKRNIHFDLLVRIEIELSKAVVPPV